MILHFSATFPAVGREDLFLMLCWLLPLNVDSFAVCKIRCKKKAQRILGLDLDECLTVCVAIKEATQLQRVSRRL